MLLFVPVVSAQMFMNITDFYTANPLASYNVLVSTEDNRSLPYNNVDNLTAWYQFNENNQSASDSSGNGNTGTLNGYSFNNGQLNNVTQITGYYGNAYNFSTTLGNQSYVLLGNNASTLNISGQFTISAWIYPLNSTEAFRKTIVSKKQGSTGYGLVLEATSRTLRGDVYGLTDTYTSGSPTAISVNAWSYVTLRYNGTHITTFVNCTQQLNDASTGNVSSSTATPRIGTIASGSAEQFNGTIDEVRIHTVALNGTQICQEMNSPYPVNGNGLVASYSFESNFTNATGNYTYDTNNLVAGQINGSNRFNGVNEYITVPWSNSINDNITMSGWLNILNTTTSSRTLGFGNSAGSTNYLNVRITSNEIYLDMRDNDSSATTSTKIPFTSTGWNLVTFTINQPYFVMYVNGNLISNSSIAGQNNFVVNRVAIGALVRSTVSDYFNGSIDDVRIYNASLSATQIADIYNAGAYRIYNYTSSNGNGTINLPLTNTGLVNMSITSTANGGYYQSWAINHNTNVDYLNTMAQSTNTFSATQKVTGLTATASFVTQYLTNSTHYMYVQPYQVNLSGGWYGAFNYTPVALTTGSYAYTGAYNWLANISASLIPEINGNAVTYTFRNGQYSFSEASTTSTTSNIGLVNTVNYNLTINATYPTGSVSIYIPNHNVSNGIVIQ